LTIQWLGWKEGCLFARSDLADDTDGSMMAAKQRSKQASKWQAGFCGFQPAPAGASY